MDMRVVNKCEGTPKVFRRIPAFSKTGYLDLPVLQEHWRRIVAGGSGESYIIIPPDDVDISLCWIRVNSKVLVTVTCHIVDNQKAFWLIEFPCSNSPHQISPATINITISPKDDDDLDPSFDESQEK